MEDKRIIDKTQVGTLDLAALVAAQLVVLLEIVGGKACEALPCVVAAQAQGGSSVLPPPATPAIKATQQNTHHQCKYHCRCNNR
jgi:hypothetical protein